MYYSQPVHSRSISRIRTRYKDCQNAQAFKTLGIVGVTVARCVRSFPCTEARMHTHTSEAHTHTSEAHAHTHTHTSEACAHRQPRQLCTNTELSSPLFFCAWINKFRQNYIKKHVLANILVNSRLSIVCLNVNSGEKGMCLKVKEN